jgi:DNA-binding response OmpR family regulator
LAALTALILDDDREHAAMIAGCLHGEGFVLAPVPGGPDTPEPVADRVRRDSIDICLVGDRAMGRDGVDVVHDLRNGTAAGIVMLRHTGDELDTVLALEMGADDYMVKPARPRELCARLRSVLRRTSRASREARPSAPSVLRRVDDLEICGVLRLVSVAGRMVDLGPGEFDVLMVLAARTNTVLSRDRIIAAARGGGHAISHRAVDGIVSRLRRKLFDSPEEGARRIRTVHGRGYMLTETR